MLASWEQEVAGEARAGHFEQEIINDSYLLEFEWFGWWSLQNNIYLSLVDFLFVSTSYHNYNLAFCMSGLATVSQGTQEQGQ